MANAKTWTLTDVEQDIYVDQIALGPPELGPDFQGCSVKKRRLRGGLRDGVDLVEVDNGAFRFAIIPTRGMGIWRAWLGDTLIGWPSPNRGPVHPHYVPLTEPSGFGFLDGFDELLMRCGLESNGAPEFDENHRLVYPIHGRIANRPAHKVEVEVDPESGEIAVTGEVEESRFHFQKLRLVSTVRTRPGETGLRVHDQMVNFGGTPAEMQILYHVNYGAPLLDAGAKLVAPVKYLVPRDDAAVAGLATWDSYAPEQAGYAEQVFYFDLLGDKDGNTRVLLKNAHSTQGVSMHFNKKQLPCFTQWKDTGAMADGYVTGLEPGNNFPNPRSYETKQHRVAKMGAGDKLDFDLEIRVHPDAESVTAVEASVAELQRTAEARVYNRPQKGWSVPGGG